MKKTNSTNGLRSEYDFDSMKGGIRGKYAKRYREGTNIVLLGPGVAEAFPNDEAVNQALRGVLNTTELFEEPVVSPTRVCSLQVSVEVVDQNAGDAIYPAPPAASNCFSYGKNTTNTAPPRSL